MDIRRILLLVVMLPALLSPGGSSMCLCWCPERSTPEADHSCCTKASAPAEQDDRDQPVVGALCSRCHPLPIPNETARPTDAKRADSVAAALHFIPASIVVDVRYLVREYAPRWPGSRAPSPPGRTRTLPLLI